MARPESNLEGRTDKHNGNGSRKHSDSYSSSSASVPHKPKGTKQHGGVGSNLAMIFRLAIRTMVRNRLRSLAIILTLAAGMAFTMVWLSLGEGFFHKLISENIKATEGFVVVQSPTYYEYPSNGNTINVTASELEEIANVKGVTYVKPYVLATGVVQSPYNTKSVSIRATDFDVFDQVIPLKSRIVDGKFIDETTTNRIVIGVDLAEKLNLRVGSRVVVGASDKSGELSMRSLRVYGILDTSGSEYDDGVVLTNRETLRSLLGMGPNEYTRIGLEIDAVENLPRIYSDMSSFNTDTRTVFRWDEIKPEIVSFIAFDRALVKVITYMLIFLIILGILNIFLLSVFERRREFSTILSLGSSPTYLRLQVLIEGVLYGFLGAVIGSLLTFLLLIPLSNIGVDFAKILNLSEISELFFQFSDLRVYARLSMSNFWGTFIYIWAASAILNLVGVKKCTDVDITDRS